MAAGRARGGDGIVANKDIQSIADLKGKRSAFNQRSGSQFYLERRCSGGGSQ